MKNPILAVAQMTSTQNLEKNFSTCEDLVKEAAESGAKLICLPENFSFLGESFKESKSQSIALVSPAFAKFCNLAKKHNIWISWGGILEKSDKNQDFNTHVIVDNHGSIKATYRKIHLLSLKIPNKSCLDESELVEPGSKITVTKSPLGNLGLSICYDLRFSGLYWALLKKKAEVLLIPAAFVSTTGKAHWEILLRARAIETQSYVAAAAQTGIHNINRRSHGHSMIIDPWGAVIAQCSEGTGLAYAPINLQYLNDIRQRIPVSKHHRPDLYNL